MSVQVLPRMSVHAFDTWIRAQSGDYEYIAGEVARVVSNNYCSQIAMLIGAFITLHVSQNGLGHVTGADGGYQVQGERYIPDVGFIRKMRQPEPSHDAYNPNAPDLTVEVLSPTDQERHMLVKLGNYLASGTVAWIVYPQEKEVHVHEAGQAVKILGLNDSLTTDLLPHFSLVVQAIFPPQES